MSWMAADTGSILGDTLPELQVPRVCTVTHDYPVWDWLWEVGVPYPADPFTCPRLGTQQSEASLSPFGGRARPW